MAFNDTQKQQVGMPSDTTEGASQLAAPMPKPKPGRFPKRTVKTGQKPRGDYRGRKNNGDGTTTYC